MSHEIEKAGLRAQIEDALAEADTPGPGFEATWNKARRTSAKRRTVRRVAAASTVSAMALGLGLWAMPRAEPQVLPKTWASTAVLELSTDFLLETPGQVYVQRAPGRTLLLMDPFLENES